MSAWGRTRSWVLYRTFVNRRGLTVVFRAEHPSLNELLAVRVLIPEYAQLPPAELKSKIGSSGRLDLGDFPILEAERLKARQRPPS